MTKQRIVGLLTIAAMVVVVLPFLRFREERLLSVKEITIPKPPHITKRTFSEQNKINFFQEKAWTIQLASFIESANAEGLVQQLQSNGYSAYKQVFKDAQEKTIFRVYVGPVLTLPHAKRLKEDIAQNSTFQALNGVILSFKPIHEEKYGEP